MGLMISVQLYDRPANAKPILLGPMAIMTIEDSSFIPTDAKGPEADAAKGDSKAEPMHQFEPSPVAAAPVERSKITLMNGNIFHVRENMLHFQGLI